MQGLRTRFTLLDAEGPMQLIAPMGKNAEVLPVIDMRSGSGPQVDVTGAGCILRPGAMPPMTHYWLCF
jgi:hypothetical protein